MRTSRYVGVASFVKCVSSILLVTLISSAPFVHAQTNLDFESAATGALDAVPGWRTNDDDFRIELDSTVARTGGQSLRIERADSVGRARFSQRLDTRSIATDRIRISAWAKTSESTVSLRIRVDGGSSLLYIGRARAQGGSDSDGWQRIVIDAPIAPNAERISFGGELDGAGTAWFDDFAVDAVRTSELPAPTAVATRYMRQVLGLIDEHAVTRADLDWSGYRSAVMAQARGAVTTADAHLAVQYALGRLGDGHSYFMSPRQMENLERGPVGNARSGREPRAPHAELLPGKIGYLRLPGFAGGEHMDRVVFAEELQTLIGELESAGAYRWILDLRDNQGGNLWPMLAGLGPLLGDGEAGASLRPDGDRRRIWYEDGKVGLGDYVQLRVRGEPYRLRSPGAPVAVLQDDETASAAEIVAAAFAARPKSRSFGTATRGATTATRTFPLMDGAALMLAVASTVDRHGRVLNGPLAPDEIVADAEHEEGLGSQRMIEAAREWLDGLAE